MSWFDEFPILYRPIASSRASAARVLPLVFFHGPFRIYTGVVVSLFGAPVIFLGDAKGFLGPMSLAVFFVGFIVRRIFCVFVRFFLIAF